MRIALIELGATRPELHEPIGIEMIAAAVQYSAFSKYVDRIDMYSYTYQLLPEKYGLNEYDVIGIGAKLGTWHRLVELIERVCSRGNEKGSTIANSDSSKHNPIIIVGDLIGTYAWEKVLKVSPHAICVLGEGEETFIKILSVISPLNKIDRHALQEIPNLAFNENEGVVVTSRSSPNLNLIPPPDRRFARIAIEKYSQVQIEASRACPWGKCSFCSIPSFSGSKWRAFPVDWVMSQLEELSDLGATSPYFTDADFFGSDLSRMQHFANILISKKDKNIINPKLDIYINIQVSAVLGTSKSQMHATQHVLHQLKLAGLREVFIGVESGAREQVKRFKKAATTARNKHALKILKDMGFDLDVGFIMFDLDTTLSEIKENILFIKDSGLWGHPSRFTKALRIQPGTGYEKSVEGVRIDRLSVNNLCYPYRFRESTTGLVYRLFREWEIPHLHYETLVQGASKGEMAPGACRSTIRGYLGNLRIIGLTYLNACVNYVEGGGSTGRELSGLRNELEDKFLNLFNSMPRGIPEQFEILKIPCTPEFFLDSTYAKKFQTLNAIEDPALGE